MNKLTIQLTIDDGTYKWNFNSGINKTVFDIIRKYYKSLKNTDVKKWKLFCNNVVSKTLYFENGKMVPMQQPIKKMFLLKGVNIIKCPKPD
jgi:hypothetical protein